VHALREVVQRDALGRIAIPPEFGPIIEVIILPVSAGVPDESLATMHIQEQSGFARTVLADPAEDIWNDLQTPANVPQDR
jgi:hypothetical protein